jgi:hypothetical protein
MNFFLPLLMREKGGFFPAFMRANGPLRAAGEHAAVLSRSLFSNPWYDYCPERLLQTGIGIAVEIDTP